jgi:hypothetical protein
MLTDRLPTTRDETLGAGARRRIRPTPRYVLCPPRLVRAPARSGIHARWERPRCYSASERMSDDIPTIVSCARSWWRPGGANLFRTRGQDSTTSNNNDDEVSSGRPVSGDSHYFFSTPPRLLLHTAKADRLCGIDDVTQNLPQTRLSLLLIIAGRLVCRTIDNVSAMREKRFPLRIGPPNQNHYDSQIDEGLSAICSCTIVFVQQTAQRCRTTSSPLTTVRNTAVLVHKPAVLSKRLVVDP